MVAQALVPKEKETEEWIYGIMALHTGSEWIGWQKLIN